MNNWMPKLVAMTVVSAGLMFVPCARAQLQSGAGTVLGSNADGIDELVDQDVAKGYYTAEQGEQLKAQSDQAMQNLTDSLMKAQAAVQRTDSLAQSGNQMTLNQLGSLANAQGQANLGGTPEEVEEQAKAIYNAAHLQLEVGKAQMDNLQPVLQTAMNEITKVLNARNALIQSNPNVSPAVKHNAGKEAAQVQDATDHSVEKGFSTFNAKVDADQATLENNKDQIISQIKDAITTQVAANGSDPSKWTKPTTPAKTTLPPNANVTPNNAATQSQTPGLPTTATTYVPSNNGSVTGTSTRTTTGTIPSNQGDPALSATRNSNNGQGTASNSSTAANASGTKPAANSSAPSNASSSANQSAKTAVQISQVLTTPSVPKPKTPPPPPKLNQQDLNNALKKPLNIPLLPVATPPSTAPPNAPKDPTAIALRNTPPTNPSGNGKSVSKSSPPSSSAPPVLMPSSKQDLGMAPHTDQPSDDADPSQNAAPPSGDTSGAKSGTATANAGTTAADASSAPSDGTSANGTAISDAANAAADAAANAPSSAQSSSQGSQSKPTIIPVSQNDPNAQSNSDSSFNAYRNNPDGNPANATSNSGDVVTGTSPNQGGFVPPNQQTTAPPDTSITTQADAAASAAAAGVDASNSAPPTPQNTSPPANPPSTQPSLADIQAQIASQLKAGNLGGHLVEGDNEMEGVADTTTGTQMPSVSDLNLSVEVGDTLSVATLASIYKGYTVTAGQNGSSVIVAGTTQVATPSSLMTAPSLQVSTPGAMMTSPSMQVQVPSSVMTDPSSQVLYPSALLVIPSSQINIPSSLMTSLDLQVAALCGR
jgi:hypothetical protein